MNTRNLGNIIAEFDIERIGSELYRVVEDLYPICRSISGRGVRLTLDYLARLLPLEIYEVPTGTKVFDWVVPKEWNIAGAYISDSSGRKVVDFSESNLHVVSYSTPVRSKLTLKALKPHLFSLPLTIPTGFLIELRIIMITGGSA